MLGSIWPAADDVEPSFWGHVSRILGAVMPAAATALLLLVALAMYITLVRRIGRMLADVDPDDRADWYDADDIFTHDDIAAAPDYGTPDDHYFGADIGTIRDGSGSRFDGRNGFAPPRAADLVCSGFVVGPSIEHMAREPWRFDG